MSSEVNQSEIERYKADLEAKARELRSTTDEVEKLKAALAEKDKKLSGMVDNAAVDRVIGLLTTRYGAFFGALLAIFGLVGWGAFRMTARSVFEEERKTFEEQASHAHDAANRADAREAILAEREKELSQRAIEARAALDALRSEAHDLEADVSDVRGKFERVRAANDQRLASVEERLLKVVSTLDQKDTVTAGAIAKIAAEDKARQDTLAQHSKIVVRIVYAYIGSAAKKRALEFQQKLATEGYDTKVLATDFSELHVTHAPGTATVSSASQKDAEQMATLLGLSAADVRAAGLPAKDTFDVHVF